MPKPIKAPEPISYKKVLSLTILQRIKIKQFMETSQTRTLGESRLNVKIIDKIEMTKEEMKEHGVTEHFGPGGSPYYSWPQANDLVKEFELSNEEHARLCSFFRESAGPTPEDLKAWLEDVLGQLGI
jgi:hypothetical protein